MAAKALCSIDTTTPPDRRFGTILVARPQSQRPTELEVLLREHSQKLRILSSPAKLSGAHMVFEKGVAIRVYYPEEISILDQQDEKGTDGIFDFCMSFQWPIVFFVVPHILSNGYGEGSFLDRAITMILMDYVTEATKSPPRLLMVANTAQLLSALFTFCDDVSSTIRREARAKIIQSIQSSIPDDQACVAAAIRNLLAPPHCPMGEAEIILRHFDTLQDIVHSCCCSSSRVGDAADDNVLDQLPIERRTKEILKAFFTVGLENRDWREPNGGLPRNNHSMVDPSSSFHGATVDDGYPYELPKSNAVVDFHSFGMPRPQRYEVPSQRSFTDPSTLAKNPPSQYGDCSAERYRGILAESSATSMPPHNASYTAPPPPYSVYPSPMLPAYSVHPSPPMQHHFQTQAQQQLLLSHPSPHRNSFDPRIQSSRNRHHHPSCHLQYPYY